MKGIQERRRKPRPPRRGAVIGTLVVGALSFALLLGAYLGVRGVNTSVFTFTLESAQTVPLVFMFFIAYLVVGVLVLLPTLIVPRRERGPDHHEGRLVHGLACVTLWALLTVTFLPLKGSETFVRAGRLTTFQLNVIGIIAVLVVGFIGGWLIAAVVMRFVAFLRGKLTPGGVRAIGLSVAAACIIVIVAGPAVRSGAGATFRDAGAGQGGPVSRVLIVGVDGCDWGKLEPLVADGHLPTFKRLMESGCYGPLLSIEPLISPKIWTSIATGKVAAKHGIYDFVNDEGVPVNATMREAAPIWSIVSGYGAPVGVVGWYVTWPADEVNGFLISDRTHSLLRGPVQMFHSLTGNPTNERLETFGGFTFDASYKGYPKDDKRYLQNRIVDEPLRWGYLRDTIYGGLATTLCPRYRPAFMAVYFRGIDFVQHFFWKYDDPEPFGDVPPDDVRQYGDVIPNYYVYQDALLARLLSAVGDDVNVIVVSDHGFKARLDPDPERPELTGTHDIAGVFIASGPAFRSTGHFIGATILDVTPTALAVMGLPLGEDMDGMVLLDTIKREHLREHPIVTRSSYDSAVARRRTEVGSAVMDEKVREELRSLGYIE
jgi:predicted AlkP superfamily phosphohydrolase/phosphomutase